MNKYESIIIINPNLEEKDVKSLVKKFEDLINSLGKAENVDIRGKKRLAYEINNQIEGIYVVYTFNAEPEAIIEIERNYRITDDVMKFLTVRSED